MEDSTAMTIEFLRARLLSERSISKTAKQRADQLAQRVKELEEQLKFVSIQRKKAEKAAAEVLAILESHGINDSFEAFDSSSDQDELLCESKENGSPVKEAEHPMTSKTRTEAEEGLSGSEVEACTPGGSLSWKSGSSHSNSSGRRYLTQARRRHNNSFISTGGSSPKYRLGKSCREIKRRETRAAAEDVRDASLLLDAQGNGVATGLGNVSSHFDCRPENLNGCLQKEENSALPEKQVRENGGSLHANGREKYGDMERALEQQAQLIGRYEAEENAQREWEEKYREDNYVGEPQDSCEPGNQSDVTEEKSEPQTNEDAEHMVTFSSYDDGAKLKTSKVDCVKVVTRLTTGTPSSGRVPTGSTSHNQSNLNPSIDMPGQQHIMGMNESEMDFPEFVFPTEVLLPDRSEVKKTDIRPVVDSNLQPRPHESPHDVNSSVSTDRNFSKGESSGSQNQHQGTLLQNSNSLGGVLEALQRAKVSLQHELKSPSSHGAMITLPHTRARTLKASDAKDIPPGTAGLFRLPSEYDDYNSPFPNFSKPYSDFGSTRHSADASFGTLSSYQYPTNPYLEPRSRLSVSQPYFDPYMDSGLGNRAINRYPNPQVDLSRAIVPTNDRHPSPYSDGRPGMPFGDNYSIYDDRFRSSMYR